MLPFQTWRTFSQFTNSLYFKINYPANTMHAKFMPVAFLEAEPQTLRNINLMESWQCPIFNQENVVSVRWHSSGNTDEVSSVEQANCKMCFCWQIVKCAYTCYINIMQFKALGRRRAISKSHYFDWINRKSLFLAHFRLHMWNTHNTNLSLWKYNRVYLWLIFKLTYIEIKQFSD